MKRPAAILLGSALLFGGLPAATHAAAPQAHVSGYQRAVNELPALQAEVSRHLVPMTAKASTAPPAGAISPNLKFVANLPLASAISMVFDGDWAYVSTVVGVYAVNISDPTNPVVEGVLPQYIWENEHMQLDAKRHLLIISRDPRGFTSPATTAYPYGALQIIDVSHPPAMIEVGYHQQPTGHTATCINDCDYLWVTGPASPAVQVPGGADPSWGGRPTWAVDITNPSQPVDCGGPGLDNGTFIDLGNDHGRTDYDHDVDVDANGIAWISGSRHVRGYWTTGQHYNVLTGKVETATACNPIPYAGGNTVEGWLGNPVSSAEGVIHDSDHDLNVLIDGRPDVLAATEEVTVTDCKLSGRMLTYDIGGTYGAAGWKNKDLMLKRLDSWTPEGQPGSSGCDSAHWFSDNGQGLLAFAFYSQGTRLLDIRDPRHVKQVGYYNVQDDTGTQSNDAWAAYWHGDNYVYVADFTRGLDILKYTPQAAPAATTQSAPLPQRPAAAPSTSQPIAYGVLAASQAPNTEPLAPPAAAPPVTAPGAPRRRAAPLAIDNAAVHSTSPWIPLGVLLLWLLVLFNLGVARRRRSR